MSIYFPACAQHSVCLSVFLSVNQSVSPSLSKTISNQPVRLLACLLVCLSYRSVSCLIGWPACFLLAAQASCHKQVKEECPTQRSLVLHWHDVVFDAKCIPLKQPAWNGFGDLFPCREFDKTRGDNSLRISHKELD